MKSPLRDKSWKTRVNLCGWVFESIAATGSSALCDYHFSRLEE